MTGLICHFILRLLRRFFSLSDFRLIRIECDLLLNFSLSLFLLSDLSNAIKYLCYCTMYVRSENGSQWIFERWRTRSLKNLL